MRGDLLDRRPLGGDRGVVAAGDRTGEGGLGAELGEVLDRAAQQRHQQGARLARLEPRAAGDALGRRLQRYEEVGRQRCGRVVGGTALVVDLEGRHSQASSERDGEVERPWRGAGDGGAYALEGLRAGTGGEGLKWMQPEPLSIRGCEG